RPRAYRSRSVSLPLERGLSSLHSWSARICRWLRRTNGSAAAAARLGAVAHPRYGQLVRAAADCVLRGQWQEPSALEQAAHHRLLAAPQHRWVTADTSSAPSIRLGTVMS